MGPRGEKGERGDVGRNGEDLTTEVKALEGKASRTEEEHVRLNEEVVKMNRTLSDQRAITNILNSTILSQSKRIKSLESLFFEHAKRIEFYFNISDVLFECNLPDIDHLITKGKVLHNSTVKLTCNKGYKPKGITERSCKFKKIHPSFHSHPFSCETWKPRKVTFDEANRICTEYGTTILSHGIDTIEQRRSVCVKYGIQNGNDFIWTAITKTSGTWRYTDGSSVSNFHFDWWIRYPTSNYGYDYLLIDCTHNANYGRIFNWSKDILNYAVCQN